jgi:hypothetical protein
MVVPHFHKQILLLRFKGAFSGCGQEEKIESLSPLTSQDFTRILPLELLKTISIWVGRLMVWII